MSAFLPYGNAHESGWFKLGRLEVGTTMAVVLAVACSWLAWVAYPPIEGLLAFSLDRVLAGEVWRVVTWPLANSVNIFGLLNVLLLWMFGTELENQVGRAKMARLLLGIWAVLTLVSAAVSFIPGTHAVLAGIGMVQFLVMLLWIAEYPRRPFFFGIPAWVVGAVLVGLQVMQMLGYRDLGGLLTLLLSMGLVAVIARNQGLLTEFGWIPGAPSARARARAVRPKTSRSEAKAAQQRVNDAARLDALLDQISEKGMDSLTPAQRRELMKLRNRR